MRLVLTAATLILMSVSSLGETLTFVSSVHLPAPMLSGHRASSDGQRVIMHLRGADNHPPILQIIDTSDIQHPRLVGTFSLPEYGLKLPPNYEDIELSADGKFALLVFAQEGESFRQESDHEIIALDLADASKPKELWRKIIRARQVRLSADASAYAYSKLAIDKKSWESTVVFLSQDKRSLVLPDDGFGDIQLSVHAKLLAINDHAELRVWDLTSNPPKLYQQEFTGRQRYGCLAEIMESGYIVINDFRFPRLGVYEISPGMPRVSTLANEGSEYCDSINPASNKGRLYYQIGVIDFQNPKALATSDIGPTSDEIYPVAVAKEVLFAYHVTNPNNTELRLYRINNEQPMTTAWQIIDHKYPAIMDSYNLDIRSGRATPFIDAAKRFEEAGVLSVLDAPVVDIPLKRAATILNDYGFLLSMNNVDSILVERIYRRAIELDPSRKVAYLNLADLLRGRLSNMRIEGDKNELIAEIKNNYRSYLRLGGKQTNSIREFLKEDRALKMLNAPCAGIIAYARTGQLNALLTDSAINVPARGKKVDLMISEDNDGTAIIIGYDATTDYPLADNELPDLPPNAGDQVLARQLSLLTFGSETFFLYYEDIAHPISSVALSNQHSCTF